MSYLLKLYTRAWRENTHKGFRKYWWAAIKTLVKAPTRSWCSTCLIEPLIPPCVDFKTWSADTCQIRPLRLGNIHGTIWELISDEFEVNETICCHKRHQVAGKNAFLIWEFIFSNVPHPKASLPFISHLLYHNSPRLGIPANIAMFWKGISK